MSLSEIDVQPYSPELPIELIYHILACAVRDAIRDGNTTSSAWARSLLTISKPFYAVLRPVFYHKFLVLPSTQTRLTKYLDDTADNDIPHQWLRDVREIYIFHFINATEAPLWVAMLEPSRLATVSVPFPLVTALANFSSSFAPRELNVQFGMMEELLDLPRTALRAVTRLAAFFPDNTDDWVHDPVWQTAMDATQMADLLDRLPALTHFAMRMTGPGDGTRITGTPFYDPKAFLAVFQPILALSRIQQVVVRVSGYYLPLYDKAMECLRTLSDPRIFAIKDEWELLSWDDLSPREQDEAHEGQSIWDLGRRVYEPRTGSRPQRSAARCTKSMSGGTNRLSRPADTLS